MSALVGYGSSDEEDDIAPQKAAKIPKLDTPGLQAANEVAAHTQIAGQDELQQPAAPPSAPGLQSAPPGLEPEPLGPASGPAPGPSAPAPFASNASTAVTLSDPSLSPDTYERQRLRELTMPLIPNFDIPSSPPPPPTDSEEAAQLAARTKKFERFLALKQQGVHFNERLQNSSSLRNPSLLPKLMDFAGLSQENSYASALPEELAVPVKWPEDCYVEGLVKQNERREKKRVAERDNVEFVPAAGKASGSSAKSTPGGGGGGGGKESRRSKFDRR